MEVLLVKLASGSVLFLVTVLSGLLPLKLVQYLNSRRTENVICILNCLAGGIFHSTCLLHMLPEARRTMNESFASSAGESTYPLAELIMCVGFYLIFFLEEAVMSCQNDTNSINPITVAKAKRDDKDKLVADEETNINTEANSVTQETSLSADSYGSVPIPADGGDKKINLFEKELHKHNRTAKLRMITLIASLCVHAIFEGLALGLLDSPSTILALFSGVSIHRCVIVFSMGMQFVSANFPVRQVFGVVIGFGILSLAGTFTGVLLTETEANVNDLIIAALESIATGSFLYVTFFEVIQREMNKPLSGLLKIGAIVIGFSVVAFLSKFEWYRQ